MPTNSTLESYSELYADSRKWVLEEWIGYITPQAYFQFDYHLAPYADVVDWWMKQVDGTKVNLYVGMALFQMDKSQSTPWSHKEEIPLQFCFNSKYDLIHGAIQYNFTK